MMPLQWRTSPRPSSGQQSPKACRPKKFFFIPRIESSGCIVEVLNISPNAVLRPDDHLANSVAISAGYCECFVDAFDLPRVSKQRCEPLGVCLK
jgi:hypothetical protein